MLTKIIIIIIIKISLSLARREKYIDQRPRIEKMGSTIAAFFFTLSLSLSLSFLHTKMYYKL